MFRLPLTIAVEIGTRQIRAALLDPNDATHGLPRIRKRESIHADIGTLGVEPGLVKAVIDVCGKVAEGMHEEVEGVGVCCAAAVDGAGRINLHGERVSGMDQKYLHNFSGPLLNALTPAFGELNRLLIANRSDMGAWGEFRYGRGLSMKLDDLIFLSVGGTVGAGIIIDRGLVLGRFGFAGQFGHMLVDPSSTVDCPTCHRKGCLSALVGGSAILDRLEARRQEQGGSQLIEHLARNRTESHTDAGQIRKISTSTVDARAVIDAADPAQSDVSPVAANLAQKVMDDIAGPLGAAIGQVMCILDPSVVVLGGIFSNAGYLEDKLGGIAREYLPHFRRGHNQLVFTEFSDHAQKVPQPRADETALYGMAHWVWSSNA